MTTNIYCVFDERDDNAFISAYTTEELAEQAVVWYNKNYGSKYYYEVIELLDIEPERAMKLRQVQVMKDQVTELQQQIAELEDEL